MKRAIYPCLWFDNQSAEAAKYYCELFPNSRILESNPMVTRFEAMGTTFMCLNGGPKYKVNSAMSYFVYCDKDISIDFLYAELIKGGTILMPLDKYDWSPRYAWVQDRYGVNWQLDIEPINNPQKIVPCLLFANQKMGLVKEAITHYSSIFPQTKILMEYPYLPTANLPEGTLLFAQIKLDGFLLNAMSSTLQHDFDFTPGNSIVVECDVQKEIDHYWDKLGKDGHYSMCGWLDDKFGVSWQIVPSVLHKLMANPEKAQRVVQSFLKMQKFDIAALENA